MFRRVEGNQESGAVLQQPVLATRNGW